MSEHLRTRFSGKDIHLAGKCWLTPSIDNAPKTWINLAILILGLKWMSLFLYRLHASLNFPFILYHNVPPSLSTSKPREMSLGRALCCDQMFQAVYYDSSMKIETQFCLGKLPETFCLTGSMRQITFLGGKFCTLRSFESTSEVHKSKTLAAVTNCGPSDCSHLKQAVSLSTSEDWRASGMLA